MYSQLQIIVLIVLLCSLCNVFSFKYHTSSFFPIQRRKFSELSRYSLKLMASEVPESVDDILAYMNTPPSEEDFADLQAKIDKGEMPNIPMETIQELVSDRSVVSMMNDPKMQQILKDSMTLGPQATMKKYAKDPDAVRLMSSLSQRFATVISTAMNSAEK